MKQHLGYLLLGIALVSSLAVYSIREGNLQASALRDQCEMLSLRYELRRSKELLSAENSRAEALTGSEDIDSMKKHVSSLESQLLGVTKLLEENSKDLTRIDRETNQKIKEKTGELSAAVSAGLKNAEGKWEKEIDRISGLATNLSQTTDTQKSVLEEVQSTIHRDTDEMERTMVLPTIQLNGVDTVGSGILISSEKEGASENYTTYALTSYHVVRNILSESEAGQKALIRVNTYDDKGPKEEIADIVVFDEDNDMALLKLRTERKFPYVARLLPKDKASEVKVFTPIYAVGCPLGNDPIPTVGEIASTKNLINGQNYWMLNAPTYFGNSGGGVYLAKTHELVGIFSKIYTHGHGRPVVISHMGLATPIDAVAAWMEKVGYGRLAVAKEVEKVSASATATEKSATTAVSKIKKD